MAGIFTVKGFNPSQSTQTFVCDGSLNLSPSQCIIINADTETHNAITLQFRARFLGSNLSSAFKTLLTVGDSSGATVQTGISPSTQMKAYGKVLSGISVYDRFNWYSCDKYQTYQGVNPESNWINTTISLDKINYQYSISCARDNGTSFFSISGTGSSTRDSSKKWLIGAYMQSSSESYRNPYSLELDLDSLKITLDGTEYTFRKETKRMAEVLVKSHLNLGGNEIQNAVFQNLSSAPSNPAEGQFYFNTTDETLYVYNGTAWIDALSQGDYTFQNGLELVEGTRNVQVKVATGANAGNVAITANSNGLAASVPVASTSAAGLIEIATDAEFTTGASTTLAVTPAQVAGAVEGMVTTDGAQTLTNKTIDADDNTITDLETDNFKSGVISTVLAGTSAASDTKLPSEKAVADAIADFIALDDLSIASGSVNYLEYDNTTGQFGAKVDGTVTASSTNLVTSGAVATAIDNAIVGGVTYKGTWNATGETDYSDITLPVKQGYMYYVSGGEDVTIEGITWNLGDYLLITEDVAVGGTITSSKVQKIDNTESSDIVRLNATQTLTNKTIDADDNTIANLATTNFTASALATTISGTATAVDTKLATEGAVARAVDGMVTVDGAQTLTNKTIDADDNTIANLETDNFKAGVVVDSTTGIAGTATASDTKVASEKAIAVALATKTGSFSATNGALTPSAGVATWEFNNTLGTENVVVIVKETSTGNEVITDVSIGASTITVSFNASSSVAAGTYTAVVVG